ncbi:MAG: hypothetical protein OHK0047_40930 [Leptolyngbyaceae cyanobacterium]
MSLQPSSPTQIGSSSLQRLQSENFELRQYLEAQRKVIASLERRVGRSLESLGVYVQAIASAPDTGSQWQSSINSIQSEVDSLCDLLSDAMLLQKLEAGKVQPKLEPLELEPLLNCVSRHLLEPRSQDPVRLICEFGASMPKIWADQELTEAVLTDLLARGLRYSDSTSAVVLGVAAVDDWVHLYVTAQRFAPIGNRDFATEIVLCCRRIEVQQGKVTCHQRPDGLQTVTIALQAV